MSIYEEGLGEVVRLVWDVKAKHFSPNSRPESGKYLRGPIPLAWLCAAAKLPGKALPCGVALWFMRGVTQSVEQLYVSNILAADFGMSRYAKRRALLSLEAAGLVKLEQSGKRAVRVTLTRATIEIHQRSRLQTRN